jgi:hypothetical protein
MPDENMQSAAEQGQLANGLAKPSIHLIRIAAREARERAFRTLLDTDEMWVRFPGDVMGVSSRQVEALQKHCIPFDWVSKTPADASTI